MSRPDGMALTDYVVKGLAGTEDIMEGFKAIVEKRSRIWKGRKIEGRQVPLKPFSFDIPFVFF